MWGISSNPYKDSRREQLPMDQGIVPVNLLEDKSLYKCCGVTKKKSKYCSFEWDIFGLYHSTYSSCNWNKLPMVSGIVPVSSLSFNNLKCALGS